jgi:hypothetical protein
VAAKAPEGGFFPLPNVFDVGAAEPLLMRWPDRPYVSNVTLVHFFLILRDFVLGAALSAKVTIPIPSLCELASSTTILGSLELRGEVKPT